MKLLNVFLVLLVAMALSSCNVNKQNKVTDGNVTDSLTQDGDVANEVPQKEEGLVDVQSPDVNFSWVDYEQKVFRLNGVDYFVFQDKEICVIGYKNPPRNMKIPNKIAMHYNTYPVRKISEGAFKNCNSIVSLELPPNIKSISSNAFKSCRNLKSVIFNDSLQYIGDNAFEDCEALISEIFIPNSVEYIGKKAFYYCFSLQSVVLGNGIGEIKDYVFANCTRLTSIEIPNCIHTIGIGAFDGCKGLVSINIPDKVSHIGNGAFSDCRSLVSVNIPERVEEIAFSLFYNCESLTTIVIPKNVEVIGEMAFYDCNKLEKIVSLNTTPPRLERSAFSMVSSDSKRMLFVPKESLGDYDASQWANYFGLIGEYRGSNIEE